MITTERPIDAKLNPLTESDRDSIRRYGWPSIETECPACEGFGVVRQDDNLVECGLCNGAGQVE